MMRLLDIPIFMSDSDIVPGGLHVVVRHQPLVPNGPIFSFRLTELAHRSTQMISSMLLWHSANLPQRFLDPFRERLKGLAETDRSSFHIRVGEHEMIDQMGKGFSCNRDPQIFHMGEIGLCSFSRSVHLFKDDVLLWPMQHSPSGNMPSQRAILRRTIAIRMPFTEQSKQRGRLEGRIAFELLGHPGPVFLERIGAGLPRMGALEGRGQRSRLFVFAGGTLAHASARRCLFLRNAFSSFRHV